MEWIVQNKEWLFSGIGVIFFGGFFGYVRKKKQNNGFSQKIKAGNLSNNIQGGKDVNITIGGKRHEK